MKMGALLAVEKLKISVKVAIFAATLLSQKTPNYLLIWELQNSPAKFLIPLIWDRGAKILDA